MHCWLIRLVYFVSTWDKVHPVTTMGTMTRFLNGSAIPKKGWGNRKRFKLHPSYVRQMEAIKMRQSMNVKPRITSQRVLIDDE